MEANVVLIRCNNNHKIYGTRIQKMQDGDLWRTWAFPVDEKRAKNDGYDQQTVQGNLFATEEFPGCPYWGSKSFVQCNKCGKLTCWHGEKALKCEWCGNDMNNIVTATEKFSVSGGDI